MFSSTRMSLNHNSLPNNEISDLSKLNAFANDKSNVTQNLKFVLGRVENIVGKGENAGYQHFLLFLQCFQKPSFSGSLKVGNGWYTGTVTLYHTILTFNDPEKESF